MHLALDLGKYPALMVMAIAVLASLLAQVRVGAVLVPVVVWEMVLGMLVGPHGFGLAHSGELLDWFGHRAGLAGLFFMAGVELDLRKVKGRPLTLAVAGWTLSLALAVVATSTLHWLPAVHIPMLVALVLTTTALGTFMPMLRDSGRLDSRFGSMVIAAGAMGEFAPVVLVSLLLTHVYGTWEEIALTLVFVAVACVAAAVALGARPPRFLSLLERTMHSSTQLPVLLSLLLLTAFITLSQAFGLETVLGAFSAGMVVGLASRDQAAADFRHKMEAVCFGFLVPFFFVVSGMNLDMAALVRRPKNILLTVLFLALFLLVRGSPVVLYRRDLPKEEWLPFALYSATTLSMVVAITDIGVQTHRLQPDIADALVAAGLLSVLLWPTIAGGLLSSAKQGPMCG
jgi:Kef-type K+ transport system membrane component KefB